MKLYEIADKIEEILILCVDHETGEITDTASGRLDELEYEKEVVALDVARYMKGEISEAAAVKVEATKLNTRATVHLNRAEWLRKYLEKYLGQGVGYQAPNCIVGWRKSNACKVLNQDLVPLGWIRTKIEKSVDKVGALKALKQGEKIEGLELEERQTLFVK